MILSMTGYGDVQFTDGNVSYALELRSLNNRYFKATIKLPEHLSMFEGDVEKLLRTRLIRGSLTYALRLRSTSAFTTQEINIAALESYLAQLGHISMSDRMRIDLGTILALPGVCQPPEMDEAERQRQWKIIENMTGQAMEHLIEMRKTEGEAVHDDLISQCGQIRQHLAAVVARAPQVLKDYTLKLLQRTNELIGEAKLQLAMDDLKREVVLFAERSDINEEVSRLGSHLEQFEKLCERNERAAGRKLDFLAQEMLRETNTIGSKANDAPIAHHIVEIKGAIDRLKEQVQNIE